MKSKILIKNFLVDKRESLELFIGFLNSMGIWSRVKSQLIKLTISSFVQIQYFDFF